MSVGASNEKRTWARNSRRSVLHAGVRRGPVTRWVSAHQVEDDDPAVGLVVFAAALLLVRRWWAVHGQLHAGPIGVVTTLLLPLFTLPYLVDDEGR